ncbi:hypothetical protein D0T87_15290 [Bacteroides sp. 51]|nr:hypothetical protein [Bacteroides sp. 51]
MYSEYIYLPNFYVLQHKEQCIFSLITHIILLFIKDLRIFPKIQGKSRIYSNQKCQTNAKKRGTLKAENKEKAM